LPPTHGGFYEGASTQNQAFQSAEFGQRQPSLPTLCPKLLLQLSAVQRLEVLFYYALAPAPES